MNVFFVDYELYNVGDIKAIGWGNGMIELENRTDISILDEKAREGEIRDSPEITDPRQIRIRNIVRLK